MRRCFKQVISGILSYVRGNASAVGIYTDAAPYLYPRRKGVYPYAVSGFSVDLFPAVHGAALLCCPKNSTLTF